MRIMLAEKPYLRLFKYIFVASVLLLLTAGHCEYSLSTPSEPPEGGIVRRDPNSSSIPHEFPVVLTAVPNEGFVFPIGNPPVTNPRSSDSGCPMVTEPGPPCSYPSIQTRRSLSRPR